LILYRASYPSLLARRKADWRNRLRDTVVKSFYRELKYFYIEPAFRARWVDIHGGNGFGKRRRLLINWTRPEIAYDSAIEGCR
jgi:hypothetical protein